MTDRIKGFIVTLDADYREDDIKPLADAIARLRGVVSVVPSVRNADDVMNRQRVESELRDKLFRVFDEEVKP